MELEEKKPDPKYGESRKFDPNFKGPIHNRGCTDILCCILFMIALLGYFAVGIIAWSQGDPRKVIYPTDSRGQFCGQAGTPLEKKTLLFYFNILKCASPLVLLEFQCPTTQLCVESCPDRHLTLIKAKLGSQKDRQYYQQYCKEGVNFTKLSPPEILRDGLCPAIIMPSKAFTRRCLPALGTLKGGVVVVGNETVIETEGGVKVNATEVLEASKKSNIAVEARQVAMRIFEDYTQSWHWILLGLLIAMVISLIFIVLLRYLAGIMVWVMIVLVILVIGYGIVHCYMEYSSLKGEPGADVTIRDLGLQTDFSVYLQIRQTWLAFVIILAIVEVIIILLLVFLRKRILLAIALIKEASRAVGHVMSSLFYPLLTFALLAVVIAYWAVTAVYPSVFRFSLTYLTSFLSTSNEQVYKVFNNSECAYSRETCDPQTFNISNASAQCPDAQCLFAFYGGETLYHRYLILFQFYNVFLFFWCANFVTALGQVTLSGAFASYYWAFKKPDDIPSSPIFSSLGRALRYHTGSLAFGSLILSMVQVIRVLLEYLDHKLKGAQNKFAKFLLSCMKCCFWCLEKCIKFLNRNAYIMIAVYGKNFCTSARDAFFLLMRNIVRVAVLDKVTDFLLFLGKLLIVGIVGIFSFFFFSGRIKAVENAAPSLNYYWVPILTVVVGSYLIAHGFFSVYGMCVDTLFLCFCEDLERNDGSSERPYFMSPKLHEILSKTKRLEEDQDGVEQADSAKQVDEVKLEEEMPLQQQDGEIQLKQQEVLKQGNEEEQPLQSKTDADEPKEEKTGELKLSPAQESEKKEADEKELAEKQGEKTEAVSPPADEAGKEETDKKAVEKEESKEETPPSVPQE
ncbi:Choline transporter-like protein 2 Solute carrier family 44 member 2 [Channa argus]|uniref:Choline transporter-like protein 2 n=1 Tax=Channa argus TaxID=215402 RepID=A0A6G1PB48_CHAAH|nr:Choline transporter-like protein 2 Solute carrier family 44 member 2 [Channa argus]